MDRDIGLSRRKVLAGVGAIGLSSVGAGLGTSAYFSDRETFENNQLTAGTVDMKVGWSEQYFGRTAELGAGARRYDGVGTGDASDLNPGETGVPLDDAWLVAVEDPEGFLAGIEQERVDISTDPCGGFDVAADLDRPVVSLSDVKPGDFGGMVFDFALCDNPGYAWMNAVLRVTDENGHGEAEAADEDETHGVVELLDEVQMAVWVADGGDGPGGNADGTASLNGGESPMMVDSLRNCLAALETGPGVELSGDVAAEVGGGTGRNCFSGGATLHSVACVWWLPLDHGNEVQGDSVAFDLGLYGEQCRHSSGVSLSTDLLAHYPFEVANSQTVADVSGNDLDGTLEDGASLAAGLDGNALSLDGDGSYVEVPDDPALDLTGPYTESAWVNLNTTGGLQDVTMKDPGQWALGFQVRNGTLRAGFEDEGDTNFIGTGGSVGAGTWTHLAVVYDGTSVRGYVDGGQAFDVQTASDGSNVAVSDATPATNDEPLTVGRGEGALDGRLDDLRIYGRALSETEVEILASGP